MALFFAGCAVADNQYMDFALSDAYVVMNQSERLVSAVTAPPADDAGWQDHQLPDSWSLARDRAAKDNISWYRLEMTPDLYARFFSMDNGSLPGTMIYRHLMSVDIFFNQDYLGSTGYSSGYQARNWNSSTALSIPKSSWRDGQTNYLYFRLYGYHFIGNMPPVFFGDFSALQSLSNQQNFWRLDINRIAWVISLMLAVFCFFIWWHRRDPQYLYLSITSAFASLPALYSFSQAVPVNQDIFLRVMHWCSDASVVFLILFAHQFLFKRHSKLDFWMLGFLVALIIPHSLLPGQVLLVYLNSVHLLTYMLLLYMMMMASKQFLADRNPGALILAVGALALWATAIHGVSLSLSQNLVRWATEFHSNHLAMLSMLVLLIAYISKRFTMGMIKLEQMNSELFQRVAVIKAELKQSYQEQENTRSAIEMSKLRERVYRDLHDDLGARLLSLIYSADSNWRADLARSALQDLRDVVSRSKQTPLDIESVMADCLFEQNERAQRFDVQLDWQFQPSALLSTAMEANSALYMKQFMRELFGSLFHIDTLRSIDVSIGAVQQGLDGVQHGLQLTVSSRYEGSAKYQGLSPAVERRLEKASGRVVLSNNQDAKLCFYFHL